MTNQDLTSVTARLTDEQLHKLDEWRCKRSNQLSRSEAIKRLIDVAFHCEPAVKGLLRYLERAAEADEETASSVTALEQAIKNAEKEYR